MNIPITIVEDISRVNYAKAIEQHIPKNQLMAFRYKVAMAFRTLLKYKPWKFALYSGLDWSRMALGERTCLNLAYIVVSRQQSNENMEPDISHVTQFLDKQLRQGVLEYLNNKLSVK